MKLAKIFAGLAVLGFLALWAAPAQAQEQAITVDPPTVDAAGPAEFTVVGSGYPAGETVFVLACPGAEGDPSTVTADSAPTICDLEGMQQPAAEDDGSFNVTISAEVPEVGLVIVASTSGATQFPSHVVTVDGGEEATPEATAEATPEATETPTETPTETATTTSMPETGGESGVLAIVGASIVIAGFLFVGLGRRLGRI